MHNHHSFLHILKNKELNHLYVSLALRIFALSMTGIFIPVYLYQLGYGFASIFFFYIIVSISHILFTIPSAKISAGFGLKHTMLASMVPLIALFLMLYSLEDFGWPVAFLAFFVGMHTSLFWVSYHIDFSKFSNKKTRGMQIGVSKIVAAIGAALGPAIGGFLLYLFGFKVLFIIVALILVVSTFPLFMTKEVHQPFRISLQGFFRGQKFTDFVSFVGHGIENKLGMVVWPLFIFVFILGERYTFLGLVSSLSFIVSLGFTFIAGKFSDINRRLTLRISSIFNSAVWIARSFVVTPLQVFIVDGFYGASRETMHVPFDALNYDKGRNKNLVKLILQREIYHNFGVILLFTLLIFFTDQLREMFRYLGPVSSLMRFFF